MFRIGATFDQHDSVDIGSGEPLPIVTNAGNVKEGGQAVRQACQALAVAGMSGSC